MALVTVGAPPYAATRRLHHGDNKGLASLSGKVRSSRALTIHCCSSEGKGTSTATILPSYYFGRSNFPVGFMFGVGTASYQIEGDVEGRGKCIWDTFCKKFPDKIADKSNGDIATDAVNRMEEDVGLLKEIGVDAYRFSISWARILPKGSLKGGKNQEGIDYYSRLIDALKRNNIKPIVTLFHFDVPQSLEDEYGGFRNHRIIDDFKDYCEVCFNEFGNRVEYWVTLNESWAFSNFGYCTGMIAPGRCSNIDGYSCPEGDSAREPYVVNHNLLLAHATAVKLYRENFKHQGGKIGPTLAAHWHMPLNDDDRRDHEAKGRALDFMLGWFLEPLVYGDYPFSMRALVGERLPQFNDTDRDMVKGSFDFIGLNYYTTRYAHNLSIFEKDKPISYIRDSCVSTVRDKDGVPISKESSAWVDVYPQGLKELLSYIKSQYRNPQIYIHENGIPDSKPGLAPDSGLYGHLQIPLNDHINDSMRQRYLESHLMAISKAISLEGANVKGYFIWSFTDTFEWHSGYTQRFGLIHIDFKNNLKRYPKGSKEWFNKFLTSGVVIN